MEYRKATYADLDKLQEIFAAARKFMKENGNPTQWKDNRPPLFLIERDLNNNCTYVFTSNGEIVGTFSYLVKEEPTYVHIYDGKWLNNKPYGTIHRIASNYKAKGIFEAAMGICKTFNVDIRIDTHKDNKPMLHLMEKYGFVRCGTIYIDDGTTRIAFQKEANSDLKFKVYNYLRSIPKGKVVTYKDIAIYLGNEKLSRVVGNILHNNPLPDYYPCFKVVNFKGELATNFALGGKEGQKQRLEDDGIIVKDYKVDLKTYRYVK